MAKREKLEKAPNNYFTEPRTHYQFVSTGCTLLDCALGGGFVLGRVANIVGDKSTSKTGIATECLINFVKNYPEGRAAYRDAEAAFDQPYAEMMGLPLSKIDFGQPLLTAEELHRDLEKFIERQIKADKPGIYIIDSLDALSDEAELERDIGKKTYGANKAATLSEMFRRITPRVEASKVLFLVVSQVRDNIGAMFGEKHKRSGGKALDFYASQIVWLAHLGQLKRTYKKIQRPYGIEVGFNVKKNKISFPFRKGEFEFHFGYGIEDLKTNANWLKKLGRLAMEESLSDLDKLSNAEYAGFEKELKRQAIEAWNEIEEGFLPKRSKY